MGLLDRLKRDQPPAEGTIEADRVVLEQLSEAGADLSQPREVIHHVHLPSREAAEAFAPMVANLGYEPRVLDVASEPADDVRPWTVSATAQTVVTEENVAAARRAFTELAAEYGGAYDGWQATV
ncbi:MAG: ribonuclease E inhibitor RraB [Thermoleophilia bacterium]|nr:ribonuclease E inhibitor RraB [Thermoleophilia bacterium]